MNRVDLLTLFGAAALAAAELFGEPWTRAAPAAPPAQAASLRAAPAASATVAPPDACPAIDVPLPALATVGDDPPVPFIDDADGTMARFYDRLAATFRKTAKTPVRIGFYGDSNGTQDFLTGGLRRTLQGEFGDAGHGYVALVRPWNYKHQNVRYGDDGTWEAYNATTKTTADARYGHAFIAAFSQTTASRTWIATADDAAPVGRTASHFEIAYLAGPWYGGLDATLDGATTTHFDARAPSFETRFARIDTDDAPHKLAIASKGGTVLLLGAVLERAAPGVVVDGLGVGSMNCICMNAGDPEAFDATLKERDYDLVVVHLGTNLFIKDQIVPCMTKAIARFRRVLPNTPVLVFSPYDRVDYRTPPHTVGYIRDAGEELRKAAAQAGMPFFDFHLAMGGEASYVRYEKHGMTMPGDDVHLNARGGEYMGERVAYALVSGLRAHLAKHPRAGCEGAP